MSHARQPACGVGGGGRADVVAASHSCFCVCGALAWLAGAARGVQAPRRAGLCICLCSSSLARSLGGSGARAGADARDVVRAAPRRAFRAAGGRAAAGGVRLAAAAWAVPAVLVAAAAAVRRRRRLFHAAHGRQQQRQGRPARHQRRGAGRWARLAHGQVDDGEGARGAGRGKQQAGWVGRVVARKSSVARVCAPRPSRRAWARSEGGDRAGRRSARRTQGRGRPRAAGRGPREGAGRGPHP